MIGKDTESRDTRNTEFILFQNKVYKHSFVKKKVYKRATLDIAVSSLTFIIDCNIRDRTVMRPFRLVVKS